MQLFSLLLQFPRLICLKLVMRRVIVLMHFAVVIAKLSCGAGWFRLEGENGLVKVLFDERFLSSPKIIRSKKFNEKSLLVKWSSWKG